MAQSILIVDDERDIVSMLNQYFCKIGYVVYTAINGKSICASSVFPSDGTLKS